MPTHSRRSGATSAKPLNNRYPNIRRLSWGENMKTVFVATLITVSLITTSAFADIVGTYATGKRSDDKMTIYYKNDDNIRIAVGHGTYMLVTADKVYSVTNNDGKVMVMDMDQVGQFAKQFEGMSPKVENAHPAPSSKPTFKKTGRTETIAGYEGDVYEVTTDGRTDQFVASRNKDVVALNNAFFQMAKRMSQTLGQNRAEELDSTMRMAEAEKMGGMLRFGDDMVLQSLTKQDMGSDFYKLPAGAQPQEMPDMDNIMKQAEAARAQNEAAMQKKQDNVAKEMGDEASDAARDETKKQIRDGVQSAIRGLFGN
jgi:hypothetical protein